jgi:GDPmannose 4,6-dehydratase
MMTPKTALITGATGQDASYLAEHLLSLGYQVWAMSRHVAVEHDQERTRRIAHLLSNPNYHLVQGDLTLIESLQTLLFHIQPSEIYHLAGMSFVSYSFQDEFSTMNINAGGTHRLLCAILCCRAWAGMPKFYFAGSSEMFGLVEETPQRESTRFHPRSVYGISKVAGYEFTRHYRETYGLFGCTGILFNHESPRRGSQFVTRKITLHAAAIKLGLCDALYLGNLDAKRDWGHAKDYVRAQHLMLQQDKPDDYVVATGETHSVREFADLAFRELGMNYEEWVKTTPALERRSEVPLLLGDATKARKVLGWEPECSFGCLVAQMVASDLDLLRRNPGLAEGLGRKL